MTGHLRWAGWRRPAIRAVGCKLVGAAQQVDGLVARRSAINIGRSVSTRPRLQDSVADTLGRVKAVAGQGRRSARQRPQTLLGGGDDLGVSRGHEPRRRDSATPRSFASDWICRDSRASVRSIAAPDSTSSRRRQGSATTSRTRTQVQDLPRLSATQGQEGARRFEASS